MLFRKIVAVYSENHTKPKVHFVGRIQSYWQLQQVERGGAGRYVRVSAPQVCGRAAHVGYFPLVPRTRTVLFCLRLATVVFLGASVSMFGRRHPGGPVVEFGAVRSLDDRTDSGGRRP
jgi:hypothetical protein